MTGTISIRRRLWLPAVVLAALAFNPGWAQQNPAAGAQVGIEDETDAADININRRALIDSGPSPDLFLLQTGDVIGYLDPCG